MSFQQHLIVVGASYAGVQAAVSAREAGFAGLITVFSDEPHLPYQRPPLSKGYLNDTVSQEQLAIRSAEFYAEQRIELRLGVGVVSVDRSNQLVRDGEDREHRYSSLVLATGASCRLLNCDGASARGVHCLHDLDQASELKAAFRRAGKVVIVGGGFIGLEAAAAARKQGLEVTVLEARPRLLERAVHPLLSAYIERLHQGRGVDVRLDATVASIATRDNRATAVMTGEGERIEADVILVGIGVSPRVELARAAGLELDSGVLVDAQCRSSDPNIYAVGDCASYRSLWSARPNLPLRLESVQNSVDMGKTAGTCIAGAHATHAAVPWFWSDQYETKLQMTGLSQAGDEVAVRGDLHSGKFSVLYFRNGRLVAADSVNSPQHHLALRRLVCRTDLDRKSLADMNVSLKDLADKAALVN